MSTRVSLPRPVSFGHFVRRPVKGGGRAGSSESGIESVASLPDDAIEVGAVVDAYGVKGGLKITPHAGVGSSGGALLRARSWWLVKGGVCRAAQVVSSKAHSATVVVQLAGCADRDQALALRGATVHVRRADFPALGRDEYYWVDLIGLAVVNESGDALGQVVDLMDNGAHSILRVEYDEVGQDGRATKAERLIPFVDAYVKTVDPSDRRIVVDWGADY
ncbi:MULTISPECIES: ribosome maturation factor RimM [Burkholderiaceae]|uniref:ribosome maturation factor RimM n=1 Tax=Burkholderiaceae TaxID=119060 RepID=UPI0009624FCB|nr:MULTISPECIES: ribosome maturation factor RimM [Burkholderiaceae]MCG1017776.1 ribosome maturation factor RimM [Mycetohabitans sp. B4]SIT67973.1 16S rRNA processing protein RimM [Burkholderia sp. b13]